MTAVDTRGLRQEHVGRRLRVELAGGEIDELDLLELAVCEKQEPCCGITYRLLSSKGGDGTKAKGEVYWTDFRQIKSFQVLGD